jgi:hypothetical protein
MAGGTPRWRRQGLVVAFPLMFAMACGSATGPAHIEPLSPQVDSAIANGVSPPISVMPPIEPDRPDVTNGSHIVDEGLAQVEIGIQQARLGTQRSFGTPMTLRVGLLDWLEARVSSDGYLRATDTTSSVSGGGNVQVGAKVRLFADPGGLPVLSILPTVNLPVASVSKGLGTGDADFTLVMLTGTDLGRTSHVDVNYGIGAIGAGQGRPHFAQQLVSVSLSHSLTEQLSPYVEGFWFSKADPDGGPVFSIDAGFIQAFTARLAVDGGFAVGLSQAASDVSVFAGVSVIVGDVLGDHGVIARQRRQAKVQSRASH